MKYVYHFLSFFCINILFFRILRKQKMKYFNGLDRLRLCTNYWNRIVQPINHLGLDQPNKHQQQTMKHQQQTKKLKKQQTVKLSKALPSLFFMSYASEVRAEPCRLTTIYISNFNNFAHNKPNQQANSDIRVVFFRIW